MKLEVFNKITSEAERRFNEIYSKSDLPGFVLSEQKEAILEKVCNEYKVTLNQYNQAQENFWREADQMKEDKVIRFIASSGQVSQNRIFEQFGFEVAEHLQHLEELGAIHSRSDNERIMFNLNERMK